MKLSRKKFEKRIFLLNINISTKEKKSHLRKIRKQLKSKKIIPTGPYFINDYIHHYIKPIPKWNVFASKFPSI
jgi:hypothetical protein